MLKHKFLLPLLLLMVFVNAQEKIDSVFHEKIENIVITGQYSQQAIDKSIYQVEVISQKDIKNRGANTIADILSYHLNFFTTPNGKTGNSEASLLGLDSQYYKVMIDNIPMVSDNGLGIGADLSKINLDNIERIEIVRGNTGTEYGSSTLTGVINIITKKSAKNKWQINTYVQEETVGKEYDWKEQGRHIQSLNISHNLLDHWFISAGVNRNDFKGFLGDKNGKRYVNNNGKRGYEWLPKEQWNGNALINYKINHFNIFYKLQYLHEILNFYNPIIRYAPLEEGNLYTYSSIDRNYSTHRWINHVFISAILFNQINYTGDFSYQNQTRKFRDYIYDIGTRQTYGNKNPYREYAKTDAWYNRGTFSDFFNNDYFNLQAGYEFNWVEGFRAENSATTNEGTISGFENDIKKHLDSYDVFASGEIKTLDGVSFRPGIRASFSTKFENQFLYSMAMKYTLSNTSNLRAEFSNSHRNPNFDELYTFFVDANHNIQGNKDLTPEKGYSTAIHWNETIQPKENREFITKINLSSLYLNLRDKIELSIVNSTPLEYKYININKYFLWGLEMGSNINYKNINFSLGASLSGISRILKNPDNSQVISKDGYLYTFQLNSSINYSLPKWNTVFSVYYKYTGKDSQYIYDRNTDSYQMGTQNYFSMLDASMRKSFCKNKVELTAGTRNIFNIKNIRTTISETNVHQDTSSSINLFYGRSYFFKLGINLDF